MSCRRAGEPYLEMSDDQSEIVQRIIEVDLAFERAVAQHKDLALFRRNCSSWELLLTVMAAPDGEEPGVYELAESVRTQGLGKSALLRFIRDRRDDGLLVFDQHPTKKSKMSIRAHPELMAALFAIMAERTEALEAVLQSLGL